MTKISTKVTDGFRFYENNDPIELLEQHGTPLYVYNERMIRNNCRELKNMVTYPKFTANFSTKANGNLSIMQIARQEGLHVDAMSPGEIHAQLLAGFEPNQIFYVCNNVSAEEMQFAIDRGIMTSVDSLSQLDQFGRLNPNGNVAIRFNPGIGAGHHEKVITAGKKTKFGINPEYTPEIKDILSKYNLKLTGINQHIGSLFLHDDEYVQSVQNLLSIAKQFDDLEFIDLGGGFGIPYHKQDDEPRLNLQSLGEKLTQYMYAFSQSYGKELHFKIEPGRYIAGEACVLLGQVHAKKRNELTIYVGTDIGQNVLIRPAMYDAHHDIEIYRKGIQPSNKTEIVTIVGNICESGDIIAKDRELPEIHEGDVLGILDAGSYGYSMSSTYNNRLRPAEIMIKTDGTVAIIRERDTFEDLTRNMKLIF